MSNYTIDFSDPLKTPFSIAAGGFDGPGGSQTSSSLRLYGRGALEWGEAVDEDLIRLAETNSSATPPLNPLNGQLWVETRYYYHNNSDPVTDWYRFNPNTATWGTFTVTAGLLAARPLSSTIGAYYYATDTAKLFRWDSAYKQAPAGWLERAFSTGAGAPVNPPEQFLRLWDNFTSGGAWGSTVSVADIAAAFGHTPLFIDGFNSMTANLNMGAGSFKIINLADPTLNQDAATKFYVDAAVGAIPGAGTFVLKAGDTMSGTLTMSGGSTQVILPNAPTLSTHAANKAYVDIARVMAIAGSVNGTILVASAKVLLAVTAQPFTIPATPSSNPCYGYADTPGTGTTTVFNIQKNGVNVGSMSFAVAANTPTFTFSSPVSFIAGDRLAVVLSGSPNPALADIYFTIVGTLV